MSGRKDRRYQKVLRAVTKVLPGFFQNFAKNRESKLRIPVSSDNLSLVQYVTYLSRRNDVNRSVAEFLLSDVTNNFHVVNL